MSNGKPIEWGSPEFDAKVKAFKHAEKVEYDKRMIDEMMDAIQTEEGERYLIGMITGH